MSPTISSENTADKRDQKYERSQLHRDQKVTPNHASQHNNQSSSGKIAAEGKPSQSPRQDTVNSALTCSVLVKFCCSEPDWDSRAKPVVGGAHALTVIIAAQSSSLAISEPLL
jgi:hypothetical protein